MNMSCFLLFLMSAITTADSMNNNSINSSLIAISPSIEDDEGWLALVIVTPCLVLLYCFQCPHEEAKLEKINEKQQLAPFKFVTLCTVFERVRNDDSVVRMTYSRWFLSATTCGSSVFNIFTIVNNYANLPKRDPDVPLNLSASIVAHVELIMILIYFSIWILSVHKVIRKCEMAHTLKKMTKSLNFSVMKFVPMCSPGQAVRPILLEYQRLKEEDQSKVAIFTNICFLIPIWFFFLSSSVAGFAMKLSQFDFVIHTDPTNYSFYQTITFLGFFNQVAVMAASNPMSDVYEFVFSGMDGKMSSEDKEKLQAFFKEFHNVVVEEHGLTGFCFLLTLEVSDISKMLCQDEIEEKDEESQSHLSIDSANPITTV